jgi:cytochrome c-type biogenesis protein CcmH/NrfF
VFEDFLRRVKLNFIFQKRDTGHAMSGRRLWSAGVVCLLAVVMLGAAPSSDPSARFGRIGHNLMCVCSCGQVLLECNHVGCPDSSRMIGELQEQVAGPNGTGADSLILNWFVGKYGATVLAAPIRGGFDNVAWAIPVALFIFATVGTGFLVKTWSQKRGLVTADGAPTTASMDDAVRERIRRETEF